MTRYTMVSDHSNTLGFAAQHDADGEWVRYSDLAAARAEIERLTKERDEARAQVVGAFEAAASVAWADRESGLTVNTKIRALTPDDAQAALQSMLADAERDMRQRAADSCLGLMTAQSARKFILALPLKHADREEGK